jgi:endo-1,4-beta-xylanase
MNTTHGHRLSPILAVAAVVTFTLGLAGCATSRAFPGRLEFIGNIWPNGITEDPTFLEYWNQVTVENAGKWGNAERVRNQMQFDDLDRAYEFAQANDIPFRLHTLIWGQSQPPWLGRLSPEELLNEVTQWMSLLGERYPNVDMIDVVNEPFNAPPAYMDALGGPGETRWDWIIFSFELARQHFPHARLGLNEYGILGSEDATAGYIRLVRALKERNLIDYVGLQGHYLEDVADEVIEANLLRLAHERLPIYITELDVGIDDDAEQAQRMEELITIFAGNRRVRGITLWGYKQDSIYKRNAYLLGADGSERPALTWLVEFAESRVRR